MSPFSVSIIIPAHNAAATLAETTASLLSQTTSHWEAIIVGDRSGRLMVPRENPNALAAAIKSLLDDATWRIALGRVAQQHAATAFSLKSVGQQLRQALNV